jgi:hypothetical protein
MSKKEKNLKPLAEEAVNQEFAFDKFVQDLENRENKRKEQDQQQNHDINEKNRIRDARNREHLHNRIRWSR